MGDTIAIITASLALVFGFILFFSVLFGIVTNIFDFKYRRDANLSLRKDIHASILENYNGYTKNLKNDEEMELNKFDFKLLSLFASPISRKRYRDFFKKNTIIDKKVILEEFKNWRKIGTDFRINRKQTFNSYIKERGSGELVVTNKNDALNLLVILLVLLTNADSINLIKYDPKFKPIIRFVKHLSLSKRQLKQKIKNNEISKEEAKKINKNQKEMEKASKELANKPNIPSNSAHSEKTKAKSGNEEYEHEAKK